MSNFTMWWDFPDRITYDKSDTLALLVCAFWGRQWRVCLFGSISNINSV